LKDVEDIQETVGDAKEGEDEDMASFMEEMVGEVRHAAAMELAPSAKTNEIHLEEMIVEEDDLVRVRILESLPEAIINASGEEVNLEAGDVHFLDSITAEMLVDGGFAKIAAL